jgi:hypothetical protein
MTTRRALVSLCAVALAIAGGAASSWSWPLSADVARADGDPASDVLLNQDVFVPYSGMSATLERRLFALCAAADRAGYPVRIALIASRSDLGVVPILFNRPQSYARFLSAELGSVVHGPVLVVMPAGLGLAAQGRAVSTAALSATHVAAGESDALATAALTVVPRLAAAAGHPVSPAAVAAAPAAGASAGTVRHALIALLILGLLSGAGIAGAFVARSRRAVG